MPAASPVRVPTQSRGRRTRGALLSAAEREFSERGYAATTSKSIAERAGVSTGSFYQYFADKDALLREIAQARSLSIGGSSLQALGSLTAEPLATMTDAQQQAWTEERIRPAVGHVVGEVIAYHRADPGLHAVLTERRHADPELERLTAAGERQLVADIAALLGVWQQLLGGEDPRDVDATAFVLFGLVEGSVHAHVLGAKMVDDERFSAALVDAALRIARPGPTTRSDAS